jgi:hypothetical protein
VLVVSLAGWPDRRPERAPLHSSSEGLQTGQLPPGIVRQATQRAAGAHWSGLARNEGQASRRTITRRTVACGESM